MPTYLLYEALSIKFEKGEISYSDIIFEVPVEDGVFRYVPLLLGGSSGLFLGHLIWSVFHGRLPTVIFAGVFGLLFVRLWLGGLWLQAVLLHIFHDLWGATIRKLW